MNKAAIGIVELRSCPFCGGEATPYAQGELGYVECGTCECDVPGIDEEDAAASWNRRTPDPIIMEMVEALEEIAKPGVGAALDWSDEECSKYWAGIVSRNRKIGRALITKVRGK